MNTHGAEDESRVAEFLLAVDEHGRDSPEVQRLLAEHPALASYAREQGQFRDLLAPVVSEQPGDWLEPGQVLDDFRVVRPVDQGGMGVIYEAVQISLDRAVALKTIRPDRVSAAARARFENERKILARLHQSNIVPVIAAGSVDSIEYFAMQFIPGCNLREIVAHRSANAESVTTVAELARSTMRSNSSAGVAHASSEHGRPAASPAGTANRASVSAESRISEAASETGTRPSRAYAQSVARVISDLALSVDRIHRARVLHCDITPRNILIDKSGKAWLIDFGLARTFGDALPEDVSSPRCLLTTDVAGTRQYMAPEQFQRRVSAASDIWGLGVILWELLFLRPFERGHLKDPAVAEKLSESADASLSAICLKALAESPEERYESAGHLYDDLNRWLHDEPVLARRYSVPERMTLLARRFPARATALVALILIAVVSAVLGMAALRGQGDAKRNEAQARRNRREAERRLGESLVIGAQLALRPNRIDVSQIQFRSAVDVLVREKYEPFPALVGLANLSVSAPFPVLRIPVRPGGLRALVVAPDGRSVWASHTDQEFHRYDLLTGRHVQTYSGHQRPVLALAVSADGLRIASASQDGEMRVWDTATAKSLRQWKSKQQIAITALALSHDGRLVAAGTGDAGTEKDGLSVRVRQGATGETSTVIASIDFWSVPEEKQIATMPTAHNGTITSLTFSRDGRHLLSASHDHRVTWWDIENEKRVHNFAEGQAPIESARLAPDDRVAVAIGTDGAVVLCDLQTGAAERQPVLAIDDSTGTMLHGEVSADLSQTVLSTRDGNTRLVNNFPAAALHRVFTGPGRGRRANIVKFVNRDLVMVGTDETLEVYSQKTHTFLKTIVGSYQANAWALAEDGRFAVSVAADGVVRRWMTTPIRSLSPCNGFGGFRLNAVAVTPDAQTAVTAGDTLRVWDLARGEQVAHLAGHTDDVTSVACGPDGLTAVSGGNDGTVRCWDLARKSVRWTFSAPPDTSSPQVHRSVVNIEGRLVEVPADEDQNRRPRIQRVLFFPDGRRVLAVADRTWSLDAATGRVEVPFATGVSIETSKTGDASENGSVGEEESVGGSVDFTAISPDGQRAVGWRVGDSARSEIVVYRTASGRLDKSKILVAPEGGQPVHVGFSARGEWVYAVLSNGEVHTFDLRRADEPFVSQLPIREIAKVHAAPGARQLILTDRLGLSHVLNVARLVDALELEPQLPQVIETLQREPQDARALTTLGRWYALFGRYESAADLLNQAAQAGARVETDLADCYVALDDRESARKWLELASRAGAATRPAGGASRQTVSALLLKSLQEPLVQPLDSASSGGPQAVVVASADRSTFALCGSKIPVAQLRVEQGKVALEPLQGISGGPFPIQPDLNAILIKDSPQSLSLFSPRRPIRALRNFPLDFAASLKAAALDADASVAVAAFQNGAVVKWSRNDRAPVELNVPAVVEQSLRADHPTQTKWLETLVRAGASVKSILIPQCLACDFASRRLAVGYGIEFHPARTGYVAMFDLDTGEHLTGAVIPTSRVASIALDKRGQRIATSTPDGEIQWWKLVAGRLTESQKLVGHTGLVSEMAFRDDGGRLYTAGADHTLRSWNEQGRPLPEETRTHPGPVTSLAPTKDGAYLIATCADGQVYLWPTAR